jgi:hypothetical protein
MSNEVIIFGIVPSFEDLAGEFVNLLADQYEHFPRLWVHELEGPRLSLKGFYLFWGKFEHNLLLANIVTG